MNRHGMRQSAAGALLACAGLVWAAFSPAQAAVIAPAKSAMSTMDSAITQVRREGGGFGAGRSTGGGRSFNSGGGRSFDGGSSRAYRAPASRPSRSEGRAFRGADRATRGGDRARGADRSSDRARRTPYRGASSIDRPNRTRDYRQGRQFRPGDAYRRGSARPGRAFVHRRGYRPPNFRRWHPRHHAYRKWHRRPYYGYVIGGVALGSILAASAYYAYADAPPADGLCWFWTDPDETSGYWDYCEDRD